MMSFQMPATTLATLRKVSFTLLGSIMLLLFSAPVWAQCGEDSPPNCVAQGTFTLEPGVTVPLPVGNNLYKFKPLDNAGGESLTITAVSILESVFDNTDPAVESCVPVRDLSEAAGAHKCVEFQHDCRQGSAVMNDCATFHYQVVFAYDLPTDLPAIGGPDWGLTHGVNCPLIAGQFVQSIFVAFLVNKVDPTHIGGDTGPSCNAPEWTPGVPPITSATGATGFVGFSPPVSNTSLNTIEPGRTVPLKWQQLDRFGTPVTNLTLCTGATCTTPWVKIQSTPIVCPGSSGTVTAGLTDLPGTFMNQGSGFYHFNWNTNLNSTGCVAVVLIFDLAPGAEVVVVSRANFRFLSSQ
jgi:hypothetical protein